jgi:hypothetical protein
MHAVRLLPDEPLVVLSLLLSGDPQPVASSASAPAAATILNP